MGPPKSWRVKIESGRKLTVGIGLGKSRLRERRIRSQNFGASVKAVQSAVNKSGVRRTRSVSRLHEPGVTNNQF
jgi:hypothetical protein